MIKFKDEVRHKAEYEALEENNPELHDLAEDLAEWVMDNFQKDVVITMVDRTDAEQDYLYRDDEKYHKKKFKSPHQFHHSLDLRSWVFTQDEIDQITEYLNDKYNEDNYYDWTAKCHIVSNGIHFHIQFCKK
jgi:hypothetical protein